ncbi:hypothetical protein ASPBRDRAFT_37969 [Aspergillus brasiliensis CBS 101740]|uniref:Uncharacterized protein n=1 Tax=Aspergillus brasiliensis (strain CBS 101740 / IMI 381727 / IBT 21946) TaxID=767769 RepID=A0A1L9UVS5_ASPBC|nr:hypothetical protein ASPBRDRAFT_37969 [Aspergillus brasiliensis CBS 101740]
MTAVWECHLLYGKSINCTISVINFGYSTSPSQGTPVGYWNLGTTNVAIFNQSDDSGTAQARTVERHLRWRPIQDQSFCGQKSQSWWAASLGSMTILVGLLEWKSTYIAWL